MISTHAAGHTGTSPLAMGRAAWRETAARTWKEAGEDNAGLVAAGVAFYGFLALVPLLGAIVLSYGLIAEPATVVRNMTQLTSVMPADAAKLIGEQLADVVAASDGKKGLGLLAALALALFGARNAAGAIVTALNIAYDEAETRGLIRLNLLALAMTLAAVAVAVLAMVATTALGHLEELLPQLPDWAAVIGKVGAYVVLALAGAAGAATLYRFGPARDEVPWVWLTPGSVLAAIGWVALTIGFGVYVARFGSYDATYGSLSAVVVLLTWLYLSCYVLVLGAELNAEFERQQKRTNEPSPSLGDPALGGPAAAHLADLLDPAMLRVAAARVQMVRAGGIAAVSSNLSEHGLAQIRRGGTAWAMLLLGLAAGLALYERHRHPARDIEA